MADVPTLELGLQTPPSNAFDLNAAVATLEQDPEATKAIVVQPLDAAGLSAEEKTAVAKLAEGIDIVNNPDHVLLFGAPAQKKISDFGDQALNSVRTGDLGPEVGGMLVKLVTEIRGFSDTADGVTKPKKGLAKLFNDGKRAVEELKTKFSTVEVNVGGIAKQLEDFQLRLLKDVALFNGLYDMNSVYFRELTMYIIAGEKKLEEVRADELQKAKEKAAQTGDGMDAQRANDIAASCERFEKKLHDLKLTRQVALQMAPQIRLLQNNNSILVERIQSTLSNTLPLWKSQILLALGMQHSQEALKAQKAVTDMTNELLMKNAETLKMGTIQAAQEAERGIIDIETLVKTNADLIDTVNEVMRIQDEGRAKRVEAEKQLTLMEGKLKQTLLSAGGN